LYRCSIHKSNEGFINAEGQWICWLCLKESSGVIKKGSLVRIKNSSQYIALRDKILFVKSVEMHGGKFTYWLGETENAVLTVRINGNDIEKLYYEEVI